MNTQENRVASVSSVVATVMAAATSSRNLADECRALAATLPDLQCAADSATTIRRECLAKADHYLKTGGKALSDNAQDKYRKSIVNMVAYAVKQLAACYGKGANLSWDKAKNTYLASDKAADKAANDSQAPSVAGKVPAITEAEAAVEALAVTRTMLKIAVLAALDSENPETVLAEVAAIVAEREKELAARQAIEAQEKAAQIEADKIEAEKTEADLLAQLAAIQAKKGELSQAGKLAELGAVPASEAQIVELVKAKAKK